MPISHSPGKFAMLNLATFNIDAIPITISVYQLYSTLLTLLMSIQPPLVASFEERQRVFFNFLCLANTKKEDDDECDDSDVAVTSNGTNDFRALFTPRARGVQAVEGG
ncbi:UNVERIFIED_CONTAM: hypothetical protein HDU68_002504 [Siphonaria sp. JEL0065]|nr:hypothetical protein HDU68_002504 [Siphonaria sp. JEL0065]